MKEEGKIVESHETQLLKENLKRHETSLLQLNLENQNLRKKIAKIESKYLTLIFYGHFQKTLKTQFKYKKMINFNSKLKTFNKKITPLKLKIKSWNRKEMKVIKTSKA